MPAYRVAELNKLYNSTKLTIDLKKARAAEEALEQTRQNYERLLRETFLASYLDNYRVTIFGSSRIEPGSETFNFVRNLAQKLGTEMDLDVVTGGGGGLMLAANLGLKNARAKKKNSRAKNFGIMVDLEHEEGRNDCLDVTRRFENFSTRLESFIRSSNAIYLAPGGLGTDLEAAMFMQLKQLKRLEPTFPILAHPFWKPIFNYENGIMYHKQLKMGRTTLISKDDLILVHFTDNLKEIGHILKASYDGWLAERAKVKFIN
ncbi:MAG: LOG family protein [Patescibacteria group bacterium]